MVLYEEVIFLDNYFEGKWVVENVESFYAPLIKPYHVGRHYYWSNFHINQISKMDDKGRGMGDDESLEALYKLKGFDLSSFQGIDKMKTIRNCVEPNEALHVFKMAFKDKQQTLTSNI